MKLILLSNSKNKGCYIVNLYEINQSTHFEFIHHHNSLLVVIRMSLTISIIEIENDKKYLLSEFTLIYMTKMSLKHTLFSFIVIVNKILTKTEVQLTKD